MRKFYIFALVATMFAACATDGVNEPSATIEDLAPETLTVSFEGEESRIQLQEGKTVWNEGDLVSVFYRSNANQKWQFQGATGDRTGNLKRVEMGTATETMNRVVVVYPYAESYYINPETYNVEASLPATQTYVADSYGVGGNIMVSNGEYNQVVLKSVCGWLKLELTGNGESIKSITLKGNNGEQVAGQLYINSADATAVLASEMGGAEDNGSAGGNLVFEDTILTEVTLNCGDGVTLSAEPTAFYIALPPQTFANGISLNVTATNGTTMTKSTDKEVVIARNHILPMAELEVDFPQPAPAANEIWYTTTDGAKAELKSHIYDMYPYSQSYDEANDIWIIKFEDSVAHLYSEGIFSTSNSNVKTITLPNSITYLPSYAFARLGSLTNITIPDSVTSIGDYAFDDCSSLTSITIPNSVTSIGDYAFYWCTSLTSVTIPDSVTSIGDYAFWYCTRLTSITIGNSVTSIGDYAFRNCISLTSVTIGNSVTEIGDGAFVDCTKLSSFNGKFASEDGRCLIIDGVLISFAPANISVYTIPDSVTSIGDYAFIRCGNLTTITIHDNVTSIGEFAFQRCEGLSSLIIGNKVATIGYNSISSCTSLTSITIPNSVTTIGNEAFWGCSGLKSITIPDSVTSLGCAAFQDCSGLTTATIGANVPKLNGLTFQDCYSLKTVYCRATTPPYISENGWDFRDNASGRKIYVPTNSVDEYKAAGYWSDYASDIEGYDF